MVKTILLAALIMLILDALYLNAIGKAYSQQVAKIQRTVMNVKMDGAVICYLFLIFGLYYFILKDKKSVFDAFLLGIVIYGVYDATTYAIFKKWSPSLAALDTLWGGVLFALTTMLVYSLSEFF
jgi:uncharacterized membrane protein